MKLILFDLNPAMVHAWHEVFKGISDVEIISNFNEVKADCLVAAGNSYGIMDGGLDLLYRKVFGKVLQDNVQHEITKRFMGEQPVGTCVLVWVDHDDFNYVAYAPTMRVPQVLDNPSKMYDVLWSVLAEVTVRNNSSPPGTRAIESIACPGLGTGCGKLNPWMVAKAMEIAWFNFKRGPLANPTWKQVMERDH